MLDDGMKILSLHTNKIILVFITLKNVVQLPRSLLRVGDSIPKKIVFYQHPTLSVFSLLAAGVDANQGRVIAYLVSSIGSVA
jgi:hypothetical protein